MLVFISLSLLYEEFSKILRLAKISLNIRQKNKSICSMN